jgi:acetyl-CoA C-acetyltransferase
MGRYQGKLVPLSATDLGAAAIKAIKERNKLQGDDIDEVILGNVVQSGVGQAPARQASLKGGIAPSVPAVTVNKVCGSGMKAILLAAQAIKAGDAKMIIAGGMESMSNAPFLLKGARSGLKYGHQQLIDSIVSDGLWSALDNKIMGDAAEYTATKSKITREEQDKYAYQSQMKAVKATHNGKFKNELIPVHVLDGLIDQDETPRADTTIEKLAKLKPAFKDGDTVTPGNAPGLNDGAAALLICSQDEAKKRGYKALATIVDYAVGGTAPIDLFYAPVESTRKLMQKMRVNVNAFDLIEVNEAFAAQTLADGKELEWDWNRVNVNGGAIALGHPIGCSGARIVGTLVWAMKDRNAELGLATICMGGGNGISLAVKNAT